MGFPPNVISKPNMGVLNRTACSDVLARLAAEGVSKTHSVIKVSRSDVRFVAAAAYHFTYKQSYCIHTVLEYPEK